MATSKKLDARFWVSRSRVADIEEFAGEKQGIMGKMMRMKLREEG